jgi:dynein heavy chain
MDKCFEGIARVKFTDKDEVYGMISAEGEEVDFPVKIDVNAGDRKGNVEKWMLEIESVMRKTLRELTRDSLKDYYKTKRTTWVGNWPGQIVLAADQIDWTQGVETAIKKENGLTQYI